MCSPSLKGRKMSQFHISFWKAVSSGITRLACWQNNNWLKWSHGFASTFYLLKPHHCPLDTEAVVQWLFSILISPLHSLVVFLALITHRLIDLPSKMCLWPLSFIQIKQEHTYSFMTLIVIHLKLSFSPTRS